MPHDPFHAFANGRTYPLAPSGRPGLLATLLGRGWSREARHAVDSFLRLATVDPTCRVGARAACVNYGPQGNVTLGRGVICRGILRSESFGQGRILVGNYAYLGDDVIVSCSSEVAIGDYAMLAHGVQVFDNDSHPLDPQERARDYRIILGLEPGPRPAVASAPVHIGNHAWIGMGASVLKGVHIGEASIVGAGSVVLHDVPPYCVACGNPARVVKEVPRP